MSKITMYKRRKSEGDIQIQLPQNEPPRGQHILHTRRGLGSHLSPIAVDAHAGGRHRMPSKDSVCSNGSAASSQRATPCRARTLGLQPLIPSSPVSHHVPPRTSISHVDHHAPPQRTATFHGFHSEGAGETPTSARLPALGRRSGLEVPQAPWSARHQVASSSSRGSRERSNSRENLPTGGDLQPRRFSASKESTLQPTARQGSKMSVASSPAAPGVDDDKFAGEKWKKARQVLEAIQKEEDIKKEEAQRQKLVLTSEDIDDEFDKFFAANEPMLRVGAQLEHEDWQDEAARQAEEQSYAERVCVVHDLLTESHTVAEGPAVQSTEASTAIPRFSLQSGSMLEAVRADARQAKEEKELETKVQLTKSEKESAARSDAKLSDAMQRLRKKINAAKAFSMRTMGAVDAVVTET